ncbi:MAG: trypsin-like peptidase domain-containing protein [Bacteroidetes bacterium]|nr:trypsin-like peptidase domain-containing protein [Bacteroidota bacterium]
MEDTLLIDAAERYVKGEMTPEERTYFEEIRKNNPELDQSVVEHIFFLNQLEKFGDTRNFKHNLNEVVSKLTDEGFISKAPLKGKARLVYMWNRSKRTIAVAASIAGIVSLVSILVFSTYNKSKEPNTQLLVQKVNETYAKQQQIEHKIDKLDAESKKKTEPVAPEKPKFEDARFRATGFLIDNVNNFIVTNAHVVKEAKHQLIVENSKGEQFLAEAAYVNSANDLAIIKIVDKEFKKLNPIPYTIRKTNAKLGEQIFMLGFPKQEIVYGEGYISAKNGFDMDTIYCQLSVSANEGNSGSPVINKNGELLGIITSRETNTEGVVFAIKSPNIYNAVEEVKKMKNYEAIKITAAPALKGADRVTQIEKVQDYVFMIKGN